MIKVSLEMKLLGRWKKCVTILFVAIAMAPFGCWRDREDGGLTTSNKPTIHTIKREQNNEQIYKFKFLSNINDNPQRGSNLEVVFSIESVDARQKPRFVNVFLTTPSGTNLDSNVGKLESDGEGGDGLYIYRTSVKLPRTAGSYHLVVEATKVDKSKDERTRQPKIESHVVRSEVQKVLVH